MLTPFDISVRSHELMRHIADAFLVKNMELWQLLEKAARGMTAVYSPV